MCFIVVAISLQGEDKDEEGDRPGEPGAAGKSLGGGGGKYVPPSMREGASKRGESMSMRGRGAWSCEEKKYIILKTGSKMSN